MIGLVRCGRSLVVVLSLLMMSTAGGVARAQEAEAPQGRGGARAVIRPAELAAMLDAYELVQAQTALRLDDTQYGQFVVRLKRLQETRRRHLIQRARLLQELRKLTAAAAADDAPIRERLKVLHELDEQAAANIRRESAAVDELLDPRQQALFRLLEERIERQKLDLLMKAQQRAATRPSAGRRGDGTDK
jgi:hypothetical protein